MARPSLDRRAVLCGLAAVAAAPGVARAASPAPAFVAVGDWGRNGDRHQTEVAAAMAAAAAELGSRFVVSAGDNFYPAGVGSVDDPQWRTSFEDVYAAPSLQTPWYVALGNHDYRGDPHAQVKYSRSSARWRMPHRYYKITGAELGVPDLDLFVTDTTPMLADYDERVMELLHGKFPHQSPRRQLAWLDRSLSQSTAAWKIVVGHHPIYSGGHHGDMPELMEHLRPRLEAHGVRAYICGHDHVMQHIRRGSVDYICSGSGASAGPVEAVEGTLFHHSAPGFAAFVLEDAGLRLEFRDQAGASLYSARLALAA